MNYTVEQLVPGVEYYAEVGLFRNFEDSVHRSERVRVEFTTNQNKGDIRSIGVEPR